MGIRINDRRPKRGIARTVRYHVQPEATAAILGHAPLVRREQATPAGLGEPVCPDQPQLAGLEPASRKTAPASAGAASWLCQRDPNSVMAVWHSDHLVPDRYAFRATLSDGMELAAAGRLAALRVEPDPLHVVYRYIDFGDLASASDTAYWIESIFEEPNEAKAREPLVSHLYCIDG